MMKTILSLLLSMQLLLAGAGHPAPQSHPGQADPEATRLWWGLIDPELSAWFARLPQEAEEEDERILWDWSWRGFLAALFGAPAVKEAQTDAAHA